HRCWAFIVNYRNYIAQPGYTTGCITRHLLFPAFFWCLDTIGPFGGHHSVGYYFCTFHAELCRGTRNCCSWYSICLANGRYAHGYCAAGQLVLGPTAQGCFIF